MGNQTVKSFLITASKLPDIPQTAVIAPTQSIVKLIRSILQKEHSSSETGQKKFLADALPYQRFGQVCLVGPALGSPAAAIAAEYLLASGATRLILFGTAGGLSVSNERLKIGDIIAPRGVVSEEGTSILYGASKCQSTPVSGLQQELEEAVTKLLPASFPRLPRPSIQCGSIWSTDGPFRETQEKAAYFSERGAVAVEMEYAALAQVTKTYGAGFAALFVVSDLLGESWTNAMGSRVVKTSLKLLAGAITSLTQQTFSQET